MDFIIRKDIYGNWWHDYNNNATKVNISDFEAIIDDVANTFVIQCFNGSNVPTKAIGIENVKVIDQNISETPIPFSGAVGLKNLLTSKQYPPYRNSSIEYDQKIVWRKGHAVVWNETQEFFDENFDENGLGIGLAVGWGLCNGNGGRKDFRDRTIVSKGTNFATLYQTGGSANAVLIGHNHDSIEFSDGQKSVNTLGLGASILGKIASFTSGTQKINKTSTKGIANNGAEVPSEDGVGKNMPPYIIAQWVERTEDLIVYYTGSEGGGAVESVNGQTGVVVIDLDFLPLAGGTMDEGADIFFDNGSKLSEGLYDEGTFGNKGIARTCAVGYEDKWEAGEQYITETTSGIIQFRRFAFNVPTIDDDTTKRYGVGSYWQMRNNDFYICTDATEGAAVWEIYNSFIPTLDQVLSEGFTGIDKSILLDTSLNYGYASLNYNQLNVVDADYTGSLKKSVLQFFDFITGTTVNFSKDGIDLITSAITGTNLSFENPTDLNSIVVPDKSGTLATLDDIPSYTTPNLTQVTEQGDLAVNYYDFGNGNYTFGLNDRLTPVFFENSVFPTIPEAFLDKEVIYPVNSTVSFQPVFASNTPDAGQIARPFLFTTDALVYYNGALITSLTIETGDKCELKCIGLDDNDYNFWVLTITNKSSSGTTPTFQEVTTEGNTTTDDIRVNSVGLWGNAFADYGYLSWNDTGLSFKDHTTQEWFNVSKLDNSLSFINNNNFIAKVDSALLTYNRLYQLPDSDGTIALTSDIPTAGVTSVGLTMPSAFTVTNSPITSSGDIAVTGAGTVSQYVRGDGSLANFPASSGGGASLSFYLNGSVSQGTFGGVAFREMDRTPILGAGTNFTINANGYIQSFITDAGVPNLLEIPAGNWNFETYFSASSGGGTPSFYIELYKWDGVTLSLIASSSANPEGITNGTVTDLYVSALAVPQTTLLATDRLAVRIWVNNSGRTITLHTEDNNLCQVITTFSTGLTALNGLTAQVQNLATGTSGTDFAISSTTSTHTFNLPTASALNRGALSSADWSTFNNKQNNLRTFQTTQGVYYFNEFMGSLAGNVPAATNDVINTFGNGQGTTRGTGTITNRTNQQGVIESLTSANNTGQAGWQYGGTALFIGTGAITLETYVNITTLSTLAERFYTFFGYATGSNYSNILNNIAIVYDEGGVYLSANASPNFKCITRAGSTATTTVTSIAVTAGQWYKLRININAAASSVEFYIDNVLVATHITNIPLTTTSMFIANGIAKATGTAARSMQTDYFMYEQIFTNPR